MLKVWGRASSINVQKVMWAVGELGLPHQRIDAGGSFGGLDTPEFAAMNPNRRIPTIDDGGLVVWESNAIVRYLATRYGAGTLCPEDWPRRAAAEQWLDWMQATLYRDWIDLFWGLVRTPPSKRDAAAIQATAKRTGELYGILDAHLAKRPYVAGVELTMGDIPVGATLYRYFTMEIARPRLPNVEAYYARLRDRPAYREHVMISYDNLRAKDEWGGGRGRSVAFGKHKRIGRKPRISERLFRRFVYKYYARNLLIDLQLQAKREALEYINAHMAQGMIFPTRWDMLRYALREAKPDGLILEFGVYKGDSIRAIADWSGRPVHGFDSFVGLPDDWAGTSEQRGKFNAKGRLPKVPANVTLHAGWFDDTLPPFLAAHPDPIAFLNIDCDIYASTKTIFAAVADRLGPGCIVSFDEYFNYHNWKQHEFKAFQEYVHEYGVRYEYLGFTASGGTVVLRILETGTTPGPVQPGQA